MSKIVPFPDNKVKYLFVHVSLEMIKGLITACHKESNNIKFRKSDLGSAFAPLYKNGLIAVKNVKANGKIKNVWYVTYLGKKALRSINVKNVS